jgi:hypothetical protein
MTRRTIARIAGLTCLVYMAVGGANQVLMSRAAGGTGAAEQFASIAAHVTEMRISILLTLVECLAALVLAVTLYGITRDAGQELALLGLCCRVVESVIGTLGIPNDLGLLWLARAPAGEAAPPAATTHALTTLLLLPGGPVGAVFFALGSAIFSYLLLRGRIVPRALAWLGVASSALLVIGLPLEVAGFFTGPLTGYQWLPAMAFAFLLGLWLLVRGADDARVAGPWEVRARP